MSFLFGHRLLSLSMPPKKSHHRNGALQNCWMESGLTWQRSCLLFLFYRWREVNALLKLFTSKGLPSSHISPHKVCQTLEPCRDHLRQACSDWLNMARRPPTRSCASIRITNMTCLMAGKDRRQLSLKSVLSDCETGEDPDIYRLG